MTKRERALSSANASASRRKRGRPTVDDAMQNITLRLDGELLGQIDTWAQEHGRMARSSAIRFAIQELVRKKGA